MKNKRGEILIWILIALIVIAIAVGLYIYFSGGSSIPQPPALPGGDVASGSIPQPPALPD